MSRAILLLLSALLAACQDHIYTNCPPIVEYTPEFQARLAQEIEPLKADSAIVRFSLDYVELREKLKACAR